MNINNPHRHDLLNGYTIVSDKKLNDTDLITIYKFYEKYEKWELAEKLSDYYKTLLEVLKFIEIYFLTNFDLIKNNIKIQYGSPPEEDYIIKDMMKNSILFCFELSIDDDIEHDISEIEINNNIDLIKERINNIQQHNDISINL